MTRNVLQGTIQPQVIEIDSDSDVEEDKLVTAFLNHEYIEDRSQSSTNYFSDSYSNEGLEAISPPAAPYEPPVPILITDPGLLFELYLNKVLEVFPDVCRDHVTALYNAQLEGFGIERTAAANEALSQAVILQILDSEKYPKESDRRKLLKRKRRSGSESEGEVEWYTAPGRSRATAMEIQEA